MNPIRRGLTFAATEAQKLLCCSVLLASLAVVVCAGRLFTADLLYTATLTEIGFWGRPGYHPDAATVRQIGAASNELLARSPRHPDYLALQASYLSWRAYWTTDMELRREFSRGALDSQYRALRARPAHRHGWLKMVEYASRTSVGQPMLDEAGKRLRMLDTSGS